MTSSGSGGAAIRTWLAGAHPVPRQAEAEWADSGLALLPLGTLFDAIRVPGELIHRVMGSDDSATAGKTLDDWLHGPVIRDTRTGSGFYYVLIATDAPWDGPGIRLSTGTYLSVPRLSRQVSAVTFWAVLPPRRGRLCDPAHLDALLATPEPLGEIER